MSHRNFIIGKLFSYKDRQTLLHSSGVVYSDINKKNKACFFKKNGFFACFFLFQEKHCFFCFFLFVIVIFK